MAIDFPNSPTNGQTFTSGDKTWTYSSDQNRWLLSSVSPDSGALTTKGDLLTRTTSALTRLAAGSNGDLLVADSSATEGLRWQGQANTGRNLVINGAMQVVQRGTSTTGITAGGYYSADRWRIALNSLGTWTQDIQNDAPDGSGFRRSLRMLCTTADDSPAAGDFLLFNQLFEGQDLQRFAKGTSSAKQFTVSFWVKSNVTGTYICELTDTDNTRRISTSYSISASATWEKKTITFAADTTGAFDNDNASSLDLNFWLGAGSTFTSGTLNTSWNGSTPSGDRAVGQTNLAAATNNYWQVTGVQLEVGPVATGFDFEPYETTLRKCRRYYWRFKANSTYSYLGNPGYGATTTVVYIPVSLSNPMRAYPSSIEYGGQISVSDSATRWKGGTWAIDTSGTVDSPLISYTHTGTNITQFRPYGLQADNDANTYFAFNAEL